MVRFSNNYFEGKKIGRKETFNIPAFSLAISPSVFPAHGPHNKQACMTQVHMGAKVYLLSVS
jgi:hypothetical protein